MKTEGLLMYNSQGGAHPTLSVSYLSLHELDIAKSKSNCVWLIRCAHAFVLFIVAVALASPHHIAVGGRNFWLFVLAGGPPYIPFIYSMYICNYLHIWRAARNGKNPSANNYDGCCRTQASQSTPARSWLRLLQVALFRQVFNAVNETYVYVR